MPNPTLAWWKIIRVFSVCRKALWHRGKRSEFFSVILVLQKVCQAYKSSQNFFHACAVAGGPMGPPHRGSKDRSGTGVCHQKTEIFRYYKKCAWHGSKRDEIWWQLGPTRLHSLTAAGRGSGDREPISPGGGGGTGSNSLPRTTRIAVWEIFSQVLVESLCDLGNFFQGRSRYRKIILDQKILIVRARAPPHRRYAKSQNFLTTTDLVQVCFEN